MQTNLNFSFKTTFLTRLVLALLLFFVLYVLCRMIKLKQGPSVIFSFVVALVVFIVLSEMARRQVLATQTDQRKI